MIDRRYKRGHDSAKSLSQGVVLTPYAAAFHKAERNAMAFYSVQTVTSSEANV